MEFRKPKNQKEWAIAVGLGIFSLAVVWNVIGIFTPSQQVREINKGTEELRKSIEDSKK